MKFLHAADTRKKRMKKKILMGIFLLIAALFVIYLGFSLFFISHFFIGTKINEEEYGWMTPGQVKEKMVAKVADYKLKIQGRDNLTDRIEGKSIGLEYVFDDTWQQLLAAQNPWEWPSALFRERTYELPQMINYDNDALQRQIDGLQFFRTENVTAPKNAYIKEYVKATGVYELIPEDKGTTLNRKNLVSAIVEAVQKLEKQLDLEKSGCYQNPDITKEDKDLLHVYNTLNQYVKGKITYDYVTASEMVTGAQISEWLLYDQREVRFNEEKVREYINTISKAHDTYGRTKFFKTTDGREMELPSAYGYKTDRAAETQQLIEDIKAGTDIKREPIYNFRGYVRDENGDIGNNYVEIDLSAQHLYVYQEGKLVEESDFVSGNLAKGNATPAGVFGLTYKERDSVLQGETYESHVKYWMPFNGNIGMHDAGWRKKFGGDLYLLEGSHGCINLPPNKAEIIYGMVEQGMPIICYY